MVIIMNADATAENIKNVIEAIQDVGLTAQIMSHEIRTPMNAIIGLTSLTRERLEDISYVENSLEKIDSSAHFLLELINDILDISRIERGKLSLNEAPVEMAPFLEDIHGR